MLNPRPYQMKLIDGISAAFRAGARAVLPVAPTGAGKTIIIAYLAQQIERTGKRVLIVAHRRELIKQASQKLTACGVQHSLCMPGAVMLASRVVVGSVQTARRRLHAPAMQNFDYVIVDEAHHAITGDYLAVLGASPNARIVGPTATPERLDGLGLGRSCGGLFDAMVEGPTVASLMDAGWLVRADLYGPEHTLQMAEATVRAGEFNAQSLEAIITHGGVMGDAVSQYRRIAQGQPAIAFCPTVKSAYEVAERFRADGWNWAAADGAMKASDRAAVFRDLESGRIHGFSTCDLVSEGLDIPNVACAIGLRPSMSKALVLQQWGRVLRPAAGTAGDLGAIAASHKPRAIVIDLADNSLRHNMLPETVHAWSLDGRKGKAPSDEIKLRACPECFRNHAAALPVCPYCGKDHRPPAPADDEQPVLQLVQDVDVSLRTADDLARILHLPLSKILPKARTEEDFRAIAEAKGYRPGWVERAMTERAASAARHRSDPAAASLFSKIRERRA